MCGIFALLNKSTYLTPKFINDAFMNGKNRGPETSKYTFINSQTEFGFHRLAINGLNNASNQPIKINNIMLICNGEIYNYKELYQDLNIEKTTDSDCEIIIHLYNKYGIDYTLEVLDGVFAFALLDNIDTLSTSVHLFSEFFAIALVAVTVPVVAEPIAAKSAAEIFVPDASVIVRDPV